MKGPRVLLFCNLRQKPFVNNLLPAVNGFRAFGEVRVIEPSRYRGFVSTGGAKPAPVPEAAVAEGLDDFAPDVVVCLGGGLFIEDRYTAALSDAVAVGIALSDPLGLDASLEIAPRFDLFYTQDPGSLPSYRERGIGVLRCDLAVDPDLLTTPSASPEYDILYYGKWTPYRDQVLKLLADAFDVRVHSYADEKRWSMSTQALLDRPESLAAALSKTRLAVELAFLDDAPDPFKGTYRITYRPFFAGACGVPTLIEGFDLLKEFFDPEEEIATFDGPTDAVAQAERLLHDDETRLEIGTRARARVLRDHTWKQRASMILSDATAARSVR